MPIFQLPNFEQWCLSQFCLIIFEETSEYKLSKLDEKRKIVTINLQRSPKH